MTMLSVRVAPSSHLSSTAQAAIFTGLGVIIFGLIIGFVLLIIRARREQKRFLKDLEERGVVIAQAQAHASKQETAGVTKPCAVLRRAAFLPFNSKNGWGVLPSAESIGRSEPLSIPPHQGPPKSAGSATQRGRLSWPFSARRGSGGAIHLKMIKVPALAAVAENPKPSPLTSVMSGPMGGGPYISKQMQDGSRPSSDQPLLRHHPAFRNELQNRLRNSSTVTRPEALRRSMTTIPSSKWETRVRPSRPRPNSVAEIPLRAASGSGSYISRSKLPSRPTSVCSQQSGNPPDSVLPPLPLQIPRLKSQAFIRSRANRSPTRASISSFESASSSILAIHPSPVLPPYSNHCIQKGSSRQNSLIMGPRLLRDSSFQGKHRRPRSPSRIVATRHTSGRPSSGLLVQSRKDVNTVRMVETYTPCQMTRTVRGHNTPRSQSEPLMTAYGSPQGRRKTTSNLSDGFSKSEIPSRQLSTVSQASSTRSSNGNPFQWDTAPLSSGKPSALKGSPSARKGHRRQNCVRISLSPTILGPSSRSSSPPYSMFENNHKIAKTAPTMKTAVGIDHRSLPMPLSSSEFAPDVKLSAISNRASLTATSLALPMADYEHGLCTTPSEDNQVRGSSNITTELNTRFSNACSMSDLNFRAPDLSPPPALPSSRTLDDPTGGLEILDFAAPQSPPFEMLLEFPTLPQHYDPDQFQFLYETPTSSPTLGQFSSPFSTIPEQSSATSTRTITHEHDKLKDSPPCSPQAMRPHAFLPLSQSQLLQNSLIYNTNPPAKHATNTIDPSVLLSNNPNDTLISSNAEKTQAILRPLIDATSPSSPTIFKPQEYSSPSPLFGGPNFTNTPRLQFPLLPAQSPASSHYCMPSSRPSPSLLPLPPGSPRPKHAHHPLSVLDFATIPSLSQPPPIPPRSPARPLQSSIQKLRRMNSDAQKGGRGESRYLQLGKEESRQLPDNSSWLDDLDVTEADEQIWGKDITVFEIEQETGPDATAGAEPQNAEDQEKRVKRNNSNSLAVLSPKFSNDSPSSVWEDRGNFWQSTPPRSQPPNSPNNPKERFQRPSPSPKPSTPTPSRKREFEVARDGSPPERGPGKLSKIQRERKLAGSRYWKRSALRIGRPNFKFSEPDEWDSGNAGQSL
ncbi:hypothetical protein BCR34DRAFT_206612 [Clohesyomyces aquaticus]|uniref:Uncharacterized protein n=1 Tax=Clohesyomyces aquaticus TaxID=1231657 RepID=A0A1Y2A9E0_9PLEO|nr:hypothetical protein BCR34DRAFT_206612 [Clohesyomyces aquaticus]